MAKAALCDVRGPLNNLMDNLSGDHGSEWLDLLKRLLRRELVPKIFQTWKTLKIRAKAWTNEEARAEAKTGGFRFIYDWIPSHVILNMKPLESDMTVDLVRLTAEEMGFTNPSLCVTNEEIINHARSLGLDPCPPQVALELRMAYKDQPENEILLIGMEPVISTLMHSEACCVFCLNMSKEYESDPDSIARVGVFYEAYPGHAIWGPKRIFVFVRRK